jgi:hypothetical protein
MWHNPWLTPGTIHVTLFLSLVGDQWSRSPQRVILIMADEGSRYPLRFPLITIDQWPKYPLRDPTIMKNPHPISPLRVPLSQQIDDADLLSEFLHHGKSMTHLSSYSSSIKFLYHPHTQKIH